MCVFLGAKAPLGLAHVKKKGDGKVSEKHRFDWLARIVVIFYNDARYW